MRRAAVLSLILAALIAQAAGASRPEPMPLAVQSASLTQTGQDLVWRVTLATPFSTTGLARDRRGLCLLIERRVSGTVAGQLCVAPPAGRGRPARLVYTQVTRAGAGAGRDVVATVRRIGPSELTATFEPSAFGAPYRPLRWQVMSTVRAPMCVPQSPVSGTCIALFPSRPALAVLHTPRLVGCVPAGPSLVYNGPSTAHEIALTFDDGPWTQPPATKFLALFERYHVHVTFFELGGLVIWKDVRGTIQRRMLADGDMIGDHTWTHPDMTKLSPSEQRSQLELMADSVRRRNGFTPCLWRPPYGATNPQLDALARKLGFLTIMWNVDPRDWALPGVGAIERNVIANARNGAIVEMHFGGGPRYETLAALPDIITTLRARGYRFVTVAQLLGLRLLYR